MELSSQSKKEVADIEKKENIAEKHSPLMLLSVVHLVMQQLRNCFELFVIRIVSNENECFELQ